MSKKKSQVELSPTMSHTRLGLIPFSKEKTLTPRRHDAKGEKQAGEALTPTPITSQVFFVQGLALREMMLGINHGEKINGSSTVKCKVKR